MKDGRHAPSDEIAKQTLVAAGGEVRNGRLRDLLGLAAAAPEGEG